MQTSKLQNETNIQIQLFLLHYPSDTASRIILTFSESSLFQHASYINQKYQSISSIHFYICLQHIRVNKAEQSTKSWFKLLFESPNFPAVFLCWDLVHLPHLHPMAPPEAKHSSSSSSSSALAPPWRWTRPEVLFPYIRMGTTINWGGLKYKCI